MKVINKSAKYASKTFASEHLDTDGKTLLGCVVASVGPAEGHITEGYQEYADMATLKTLAQLGNSSNPTVSKDHSLNAGAAFGDATNFRVINNDLVCDVRLNDVAWLPACDEFGDYAIWAVKNNKYNYLCLSMESDIDLDVNEESQVGYIRPKTLKRVSFVDGGDGALTKELFKYSKGKKTMEKKFEKKENMEVNAPDTAGEPVAENPAAPEGIPSWARDILAGHAQMAAKLENLCHYHEGLKDLMPKVEKMASHFSDDDSDDLGAMGKGKVNEGSEKEPGDVGEGNQVETGDAANADTAGEDTENMSVSDNNDNANQGTEKKVGPDDAVEPTVEGEGEQKLTPDVQKDPKLKKMKASKKIEDMSTDEILAKAEDNYAFYIKYKKQVNAAYRSKQYSLRSDKEEVRGPTFITDIGEVRDTGVDASDEDILKKAKEDYSYYSKNRSEVAAAYNRKFRSK